jgi:hypothetical protein
MEANLPTLPAVSTFSMCQPLEDAFTPFMESAIRQSTNPVAIQTVLARCSIEFVLHFFGLSDKTFVNGDFPRVGKHAPQPQR